MTIYRLFDVRGNNQRFSWDRSRTAPRSAEVVSAA
jgi:hypothetical protein